MDYSDKPFKPYERLKKADKAPAYHSDFIEHFQGNFPLFVNRYEEGFELREHSHAYIEIVYVLSGEGFHYIGTSVEKTSKGSLYILPVGTSHLFRPSSPANPHKLLVYNLCIRPEFIDELASWIGYYGDAEAASIFKGRSDTHLSLIDQKMELAHLFELLHREYTAKLSGFEAGLFSGVLQLSVQIHRLLTKAQHTEASFHSNSSGRTELLRILKEIDTRFTEPLTVERLAAEAGMSKRNFIRLFRTITGMSFSEYLQHRRVELACQLLRNSDHTIISISRIIGYRDAAHFREVFRRVMGSNPRDYRIIKEE
ncbi:helix-turn-helix domain-containing protein [Paenibacillus sp. LMG 31459]|uniref:Helix-turn-helix domain-containing protein n=1 Tax=Paenibacillus phytohabitans TaxID=2654978 RepID=A0ABX1YG57_9BACL|nr:AraC family transcriptional regulator [Paenibacillus phytohabitans]NOU79454.1 helix-turn-helix domain-containing protein [Paenibacillus phytohabitans]